MNGHGGGLFLVANTVKPVKIQMKAHDLSPPSHFSKTISGPDWSPRQADSGPRALYFTALK